MSEYPHMPPISKLSVFRLSASQISLEFRGVYFVINKDEAIDIITKLENAMFGPGPEIVCEVVEQVVI